MSEPVLPTVAGPAAPALRPRRLRSVAFCAAVLVACLAPPAFAEGAPDPRAIEARAAVARALSSNASLRATQLGLEQARQGVLAEEGRYPYVFGAIAGYTRQTTPRLGAGDSVSTSSSRAINAGTSLSRQFPTGTSAEVRVDGQRYENDSTTGFTTGTAGGAGYTVSGRATVVQPLLRGFGTTVGEQELRTARKSHKVAEKTLRRVESTLVRDTLNAYWELSYAVRAAEIERSSLDLAKRQRDEAVQQAQAGALAPASVLTFETRAAELEEQVVSAEAQQRQRSLSLAELLGASSDPGADTLVASSPDAPAAASTRARVEESLRKGSVELAEQEARVDVARTRLETAGESGRPRLDLEGYLETAGVSENVPGAFGRAGRLGWVTTHVGAVFELPLSDTRKDAERADAVLGLRIAEQNLKGTREAVAADASFAVTSEEAARRLLELSQKTLETAERNYEAERARFELGGSIPIQVQEAEDDLRRARLRVARAQIDLAEAQVAVQHLTGELLARYTGTGR